MGFQSRPPHKALIDRVTAATAAARADNPDGVSADVPAISSRLGQRA